jgi:hypothetical protein
LPMSKDAMRQESERLVREAMARNVTITRGKTRLDVQCGKCGAPIIALQRRWAKAGWNTPARNAATNKRPCDRRRPGGWFVRIGACHALAAG